MNRRKFFGTLFGLAVAPTVVAKVLSAPPTPKYKLYRDKHSGLVGYKGKEFMRAGVINAPYMPIATIPDLASVKPMDFPKSKVFRFSYKHDDAAKKIF
jgi:hypothetical protein